MPVTEFYGGVPLPHPRKGQIQVIFGPMFSGKTTELIRRCKRYQLAKYRCIVVKYKNDNRYSEEAVATHDSITLQAVPAMTLSEVHSKVTDYEVIGIDEGQFFVDIIDAAEKLANEGKVVIVAALDGDFQRKVEVIGGAEKYMAVCRECHKDRSPTKILPLRPEPIRRPFCPMQSEIFAKDEEGENMIECNTQLKSVSFQKQ